MYRYLATLLVMALAAATAGVRPSEDERFNTWLDAGWEETLLRYPILATRIGDPRYNDRVVNFTTAAWRADNRRYTERRLKQLQGFNRSALRNQDRLSYDILKRDLEESLEGERFPDWLAKAEASGVEELARFSGKLRADQDAVQAGLTLRHSNGQTEGHVTKLKLVKRQGYGRAKVDLLRKRLLRAA